MKQVVFHPIQKPVMVTPLMKQNIWDELNTYAGSINVVIPPVSGNVKLLTSSCK